LEKKDPEAVETQERTPEPSVFNTWLEEPADVGRVRV
jgi:hypothetical protein